MSPSHGASYERVLFVLGLMLVAVTCVVHSRKIDCTRFVFAPKCRGVAAKRAQAALIDPDNDADLHTTLNRDTSMGDDSWGSDDSGTNAWQRLQYLLNKLGGRRADVDSEAEQDLWERLMASRALRH